ITVGPGGRSTAGTTALPVPGLSLSPFRPLLILVAGRLRPVVRGSGGAAERPGRPGAAGPRRPAVRRGTRLTERMLRPPVGGSTAAGTALRRGALLLPAGPLTRSPRLPAAGLLRWCPLLAVPGSVLTTEPVRTVRGDIILRRAA